MTKTEMNHFRRILRNSHRETASGVESREALVIESSPDELDRIQSAYERDYAIGSLERGRSRIREIQAALHRLEDGSYGICVSCDEAIPAKRLAAVPWTAFCIVCQEAEDLRQKTHGSEGDILEIEAAA